MLVGLYNYGASTTYPACLKAWTDTHDFLHFKMCFLYSWLFTSLNVLSVLMAFYIVECAFWTHDFLHFKMCLLCSWLTTFSKVFSVIWQSALLWYSQIQFGLIRQLQELTDKLPPRQQSTNAKHCCTINAQFQTFSPSLICRRWSWVHLPKILTLTIPGNSLYIYCLLYRWCISLKSSFNLL